MQWDTISDQWLWLRARGSFLVLFGALAAYYFYKPKAYGKRLTMQFKTRRDGFQLDELIFLILNQLATLSSR